MFAEDTFPFAYAQPVDTLMLSLQAVDRRVLATGQGSRSTMAGRLQDAPAHDAEADAAATEASLTALSRLIINLFLPSGEALKLFNFLWRYVPWDLRSQAEIKKYGCICEGPQFPRPGLSPSDCRSGTSQHCPNSFKGCLCI